MKHNLVELRTMAVVGPRDPVLPEAAPFVPMDAVKVGIRHPVYTESRGRRGGVRARANDVLFARITPCLENGKVAQLPADSQPTGGSTEFLVVRPGPELDPGFLYYWSLSPRIRDLAQAKMTGTTGRMRLGGKDLATFPIPRFDLAEQRRIVEILEDHLSRLDAADASLAAATRRTDAILLSYLTQVMREFARETVPSLTLSEVAETSLGKMLDAKKATGTLTPYLANINVRWGAFDLANLKSVPLTQQERSRLTLEPGDVIACEGGEPGRCAVWTLPDSGIAYQKALHRIRVRDLSQMHPEFLALMLRQRIQSGSADRLFTGTTIKHLPQEKLRSIDLPVPALERQLMIVDKAQSLTDASERARLGIEVSSRRAQALKRGVLAAAFEGKLTGRHTDAEVIEAAAAERVGEVS